jgi:protocatechuate 3,4-dioxygenase beta subunit
VREKPPIRAVVSFGLLALLVSVGIWWSDGLASLADADTNPTTDSNPLARRTHEVRPEEGLRSEGRLASNSTGISNFDRRPALDNPKEEDPRVLALTGQVVDVSLRPVRGAAIRWLDSPNEKQRILGRTDAEGFFAVPRPSTDGLRLRIIEQSTGLQEVHVPRGELETPYDLGRIVLRAQGVIAGQVVFPNGKPVREFPVQLRHVNEDDKDDPPGAFLWTQHTVTDDRGAFRFATLQHRRYVVYLPEADSLEERERLERSEPIERCFAVGTTEIRLTTAIQRLRVRILDNEGRSSTWEELKITHFHSESLPQTQRMLEAGKDPMQIDGEVLPGVYGASPGHGAWETLYRFPVLVEFRARTSKHDWSEPWRRRFERPAAPFEQDVVLRSGTAYRVARARSGATRRAREAPPRSPAFERARRIIKRTCVPWWQLAAVLTS